MAGTQWFTHYPKRKARSSEVNANFDWLEGHIVPQINGTKTDATYDLGETLKRFRNLYLSGAITMGTTTRYYSVPPSAFQPIMNTTLFEIFFHLYNAGHATIESEAYAPVHLPHGAIVTSVKAWWYRDDASAAGSCSMRRILLNSYGATSSTMATCNSDVTTGNHAVTDITIADATIDNSLYAYSLYVAVNPNDAKADVIFYGSLITYTITVPLP